MNAHYLCKDISLLEMKHIVSYGSVYKSAAWTSEHKCTYFTYLLTYKQFNIGKQTSCNLNVYFLMLPMLYTARLEVGHPKT